jgi:hypothetical protein
VKKRIAATRTLAGIRTLIDEAVALTSRARTANNLDLWRAAVEMRRRAERRGGEILATEPQPAWLSKAKAARWRRYALMTSQKFEAAMKTATARRPDAASCTGIKMLVSPWSVDELGFPSRTITAESPPDLAEGGAATAT